MLDADTRIYIVVRVVLTIVVVEELVAGDFESLFLEREGGGGSWGMVVVKVFWFCMNHSTWGCGVSCRHV